MNKKIDYYTGLKGVACLVVSINHCMGAFMDYTELKSKWFCIFFNGTFMVSVFVILSNYFLARSILTSTPPNMNSEAFPLAGRC